jgi:micrococcal nuclease
MLRELGPCDLWIPAPGSGSGTGSAGMTGQTRGSTDFPCIHETVARFPSAAALVSTEFLAAEVNAQSQGIGIWDPEVNSGGPQHDYETLIPWWYLRDSVIQDFRARDAQSPVLSVRLDHGDIVAAAEIGRQITVFCDLQGGINRWPGDGALVYAGSPTHRFNLWIPDRFSSDAQATLRLIETRYAGQGRGYVYVSGNASLYPPTEGGTPQIMLNEFGQPTDRPPGP